jgi:hypothetical protein
MGFCVASTKNGSPSRCRSAPDGDLVLLHRLQKAAWVLGGVRLISSARTTLAKIGTAAETQLPRAGLLVFLDHLRAGDVRGHQIGRELNPVVRKIECIGQRVDHERLGEPGNSDQKAVPAREDRDQEFLEDRVLPDDHLAHLSLELGEGVFQPLDRAEVVSLQGGLFTAGDLAHVSVSLGSSFGYARGRFGSTSVASGELVRP